jgi:hypothetical protein
MKIDPGMHIGLSLVFFGKTGVTRMDRDPRADSPKVATQPPVLHA